MAEDRYIEGFLAGQAVAYCERVNSGCGLAAQMSFPQKYAVKIVRLIEQEGCMSASEPWAEDRIRLWIYRDALVKQLIDQVQSSSNAEPSELDVWRMGKLLGYSDHEVLAFIRRSMSTSPAESSPLPFADMSGAIKSLK